MNMPTDDTSMKYNLTKHMYVLEIDYCRNTLGIDFVSSEGSLTKATSKLLSISKAVYHYIYSFTHYKNQMEYWLATDADLRPIILDALEEQAIFEYEMSAEFYSKQFGTNPLNGVHNPIIQFRGEARIAPNTVLALRENKVLYNGQRFGLTTTYDYTVDGY